MRKLLATFKETGSIHNVPRLDPPLSVTNEVNATAILGAIVDSPKKSIRKLAQETGIKQTSIQCILTKHKFHHSSLTTYPFLFKFLLKVVF